MGCCCSRQQRSVAPFDGGDSVLPSAAGAGFPGDTAAIADVQKDGPIPDDKAESSDDDLSSLGPSSEEESSGDDTGLSPEQRWMKQDERQKRQERRRRRAKKKEKLAAKAAAEEGGEATSPQKGAGLDECYTIEASVGRGSYSLVSRCVQLPTGATFALKTVQRKRAPSEAQLQEEVEIMKLLAGAQHDNVVKLKDLFEEPTRVHFVMELCTGGELADKVIALPSGETFGEKVSARFSKQMASALAHLHARHIAHRDLKPENFMLEEKDEPLETATLKMIDFGLSRRFVPGTAMSTLACTVFYVAPEVLGGSYFETCDLWSLGASIYVLLCAAQPFGAEGAAEASVLRLVKAGSFDRENATWKTASSDAQDLIQQLLQLDAKQRLKADQVLVHAWLQ
eukprot:gb/GFBE01075356.1/.p1 GENE.gb/GFBE01075356.1/~~gb/GFBE01075356.1/.p1  ORF type:complete len:397 (+),score=101.83 gb/GFBE01075356.1/:1-1191(+)